MFMLHIVSELLLLLDTIFLCHILKIFQISRYNCVRRYFELV